MAYVVKEKRFSISKMEWFWDGASRPVAKYKTREAAEDHAFRVSHAEDPRDISRIFTVEKA